MRRHIRKQHDVYDEDAEVSDDDYIPDDDENNQRPQVIVTHRDVDDDKHRCIYCKAALSSAEELAVHLGKNGNHVGIIHRTRCQNQLLVSMEA